MGTFVKEIEEELTQKLIPFWENLRDEEYGGFYGYMGYDLKVQKDYEKGCILNSRILWFFANAYMTLGEEKLKEDDALLSSLKISKEDIRVMKLYNMMAIT